VLKSQSTKQNTSLTPGRTDEDSSLGRLHTE